MAAWALREAKNAFETVFDRACNGEPQTIARDEGSVVVVVALADYRPAPKKSQEASILKTLGSCPCGDELAASIEDGRSNEPSYFERQGGFAQERS